MRLATLLPALLCACASGPNPLPAGEPTNAQPVEPEPETSTVEPALDAGSASEDAGVAALPREGAPGDTRGTISCGSVRCTAATEACANSGNGWHCVPLAQAAEQNGSVYMCDDVSDCKGGTRCCQTFASAQEYISCEAREGDCAVELCDSDATCPKGQQCAKGACSAKRLPATCAGKKRCQSEQESICVWSKGKGQCASVERAESLRNDEAGMFECTRPDDCGGWKCCTSMSIGVGATFCQSQCDMANSMQLCNSTADCRAYANAVCGDSSECKKKTRCTAASAQTSTPGVTPSWMKVCTTG